MRRAKRFLALSLLWAGLVSVAEQRQVYERAVVGLEVTYQAWDEDRPWAKRQPATRRAAAVLIDRGLLLTSAEMIDQATLIRLETFGRSRSVEPRVARIDLGVNLALLAIDDPAALKGLEPAAIADRTPTSGSLKTVRWRGQQLEAATSRIVRFEVQRSWGSETRHAFLHLQTDMSGGGWGEPVFDGERLVGVTISQNPRQQSRMIPIEIVRAFLEGGDAGFAALGVAWQVNGDAAVTEFLGQTGVPRGILIRQVSWGTSACGSLEPRDILLELDGEPIDAEGFYRHARLGQLQFQQIIAERFRPGDPVPARVLRDGEERALVLTARPYPSAMNLVPNRRYGPPPYVIAGGLLIRELDLPYLQTWGDGWADAAPMALLGPYYFEQQGQTPRRRRIVLITSVLPAAYNLGYQDIRDAIVEMVNGVPIGKIEDVLEGLGSPQGGFHVIDLSPESSRGRIVLEAATLESATAEILEHYDVPAAMRPRAEPLPPAWGDCPDQY